MSACAEPVRTGIVAVCVEYGRPMWPITMLNQTRVQIFFFFFFLAPYARTTRYEEDFCLKAKSGLGRFALSALRFSGSSLILSCLTVSFSCGIVYSLAKRMPESEKKRTYAYLIKRKIKKKMLVYVPGWDDLRKPRKKDNIFMVCTGTKIKNIFLVILIPKLSLNFRTS